MPENIQFNLMQVKVLKYNLTKANLKDFDENKEVAWHFTFSIRYSRMPEDKQGVKIIFGNKLHYKDDPEKKAIVNIETESKFWVTRKVSTKGKMFIMYRLLTIACWNLQGAYAAKTEGTSLANIVAGAPKFEQFEEKIKKDMENGWRV